jgi:predicted nucleic acid-binding protein
VTDQTIYLVDANVLLRYLMNDHPEHGRAAKKLIEQARSGRIALHVPFVAVMETIFTLQSFYKIEREDIGREFLKVLSAPGIKLVGPSWILDAIEESRTRNVSFGDACIAAEARMENLPIASFDRGLDSFSGIKRFEPKEEGEG